MTEEISIQKTIDSLEELLNSNCSKQVFNKSTVDNLVRDGFIGDINDKILYEHHNLEYTLSEESLLFLQICKRMTASLYSQFPEYKITAENNYKDQIEELIGINKTHLETVLYNAVSGYVKYGICLLQIDDNNQLYNVEAKSYCLTNGILSVVARFLDGEAIKMLNTLLVVAGIDHEVKPGDDLEFYFYDNKKFLKVSNKYIYLQDVAVDNLFIYKKIPLINSAYRILNSLARLYKNKRHAVNSTRIKIAFLTSAKEYVEKLASNEAELIEIPSAYGATNADISKIIQYLDLTPVVNIHQAIETMILSEKNELMSSLDISDLYTNQDTNTNETRIAAQNRVQLSLLSRKNEQQKVNVFIENAIKYWLSVNIGCEVEELSDLSFDSISILEKEQQISIQEADTQKIINVIQSLENADPAVYPIVQELLQDTVNNSTISSDVKGRVLEASKMITQMKQNPQQNPPSIAEQMQAQKVQVDIAKTQAQTNLINTQAQTEVAKARAEQQKIVVSANKEARIEQEHKVNVQPQYEVSNG